MTLFAALLLAHLIADFPLQTSTIYALKVQSWKGVAIHVLLHVVVTALLLQPLLTMLPLLLILGVAHFIIDYAKVQWATERQWPGFLVDQMAHLLVVAVLAYCWQGVLISALPMVVVWPLLGYTLFLGSLVFLWTLAGDLVKANQGGTALVQWSYKNLLRLSNYAGLLFFWALLNFCLRQTSLLYHSFFRVHS